MPLLIKLLLPSLGKVVRMSKEQNLEGAVYHIQTDTRYKDHTVVELLLLRKNMINSGADSYDVACVQYWLMSKQGRLPWTQ